jgi:hypothetical protein
MDDAKNIANQNAKLAATQLTIKTKMPETYNYIQERAKQHPKGTFGLVKRGVLGEPGCFYAFERGHVVGTPFNGHQIQADVAVNMVRFGCAYVCIFAGAQSGTGAQNGTH